MPFFDYFYPFIRENFNKNYDKLIEFAEKKLATDFKNPTTLRTGFYSMYITINYEKVLNRLKEAKEFIQYF
jgi:hypothetical protein